MPRLTRNAVVALALGVAFAHAATAGAATGDAGNPGPAGARFVSPSGDDRASGGEGDPWRSLDRAIEAAPAGATVVVAGGTYRTGDLVMPRPLTVRARPGERVVLTGSVVVEGFVRDGEAWRKDDWHHRFARPGDQAKSCPDERPGCPIDPAAPEADLTDMVFVDGEPLAQVTARDQVAPGTFYVDHAAGRLFVGTDPTGRTVEGTVHARGLRIGPPAAGAVIRGLELRHYAEDALQVGAPRVTVEDSTFVHNAVTGLELCQSCGAADVVVRTSTFRSNGQVGMRGGADRLLVERSAFVGNNAEGFSRSWGAAGIKVYGARGMVLRDNLVAGNDGHGLWLDTQSNDATIVRNVLLDNTSSGIFFEISRGAVIAGNVAVGGGTGIKVANSAQARVLNNTLVGNERALEVRRGDRAPNEQEIRAHGVTSFEVTGTVVRNNLLSDARQELIDTYRHDCRAGLAPMLAALDTNGYHRSEPVEAPLVTWWEPPRCGERYATLAEFRGASGHERGGLALRGPSPVVDVAGGDHRLVPGSAAIGAGAPLPADVAAALGVLAGAPVDLGAPQAATRPAVVGSSTLPYTLADGSSASAPSPAKPSSPPGLLSPRPPAPDPEAPRPPASERGAPGPETGPPGDDPVIPWLERFRAWLAAAVEALLGRTL